MLYQDWPPRAQWHVASDGEWAEVLALARRCFPEWPLGPVNSIQIADIPEYRPFALARVTGSLADDGPTGPDFIEEAVANGILPVEDLPVAADDDDQAVVYFFYGNDDCFPLHAISTSPLERLQEWLAEHNPDDERDTITQELEQHLADSLDNEQPAILPLDRVTPVPWVPAWKPLTGAARDRLMARLREFESTVPYEDPELLVRGFRLPFLTTSECLLCELLLPQVPQIRPWDGYRRAYVIWVADEGALYPLDWSSTPIHQINGHHGLTLSDASVELYLRYFCWAIRGDEGRFWVLDDERALLTPEIPGSGNDAAERFWAEHKRQELTRIDAGDRGWQMWRLVRYGNALFGAHFSVDTEGDVEMLDDEPMYAELQVLPDETHSARDDSVFRIGRRAIIDHYLWKRCCSESFRACRRSATDYDRFEDWLETAVDEDGVDVIADQEIGKRLRAPSGFRRKRRVVLRNIHFREHVSFRRLQLTAGLEICNCRFDKGLDLAEIRSQGSVTVHCCTIGSGNNNSLEMPVVLDLEQARIEGHLDCRSNLIVGRFRASLARIEGDLRLAGARVQRCEEAFPREVLERTSLFHKDKVNYPVVLPNAGRDYSRYDILHEHRAVDLVGARIDGDLDIGVIHAESLPGAPKKKVEAVTLVAGVLDARGARVAGAVRMQGLFCLGTMYWQGSCIGGDVNAKAIPPVAYSSPLRVTVLERGWSLYDSRIGGDLEIGGVYVGQTLYLTHVRVEGSCVGNQYALRIGQNLDLSGARIKSVCLDGLQVRGAIEFDRSEFGLLSFGIGKVHAATEQPFGRNPEEYYCVQPCRAGAVNFRSSKVRTHVICTAIQVGSDAEGAQPAGAGEAPFELQDCDIGGDLRLFEEGAVKRILEAESDDGVKWRLKPEDDESFTTKQLKQRLQDKDLKGSASSVLLSNNRIGGDVDIRNLMVAAGDSTAGDDERGRPGLIDLGSTAIGGDLRVSAYQKDDLAQHHPLFRTRCDRMDLRLCTIGGDADLSGLEVGACDAASRPVGDGDVQGIPSGDLLARKLKVEGTLRLDRSCERDAADGGTGLQDACARLAGRLDLAAAEVNHLVVSGTVFGTDSGGADRPAVRVNMERARIQRLEVNKPFPGRLDLSNTGVERWQVAPEDFRAILHNTAEFSRQAYLAIERHLRNQGHEREAARVFRDMRQRAMMENWRHGRWGRGLANLFVGLTTGHWTQSWRPLLLVLLTFPTTFWVFSNPANVVAATGVLEVQSALLPASGDKPQLWQQLEQGPASGLQARWSMQDALGMSLRYVVPIVELFPQERWMPAHSDVRLLRVWEPGCRPGWRHTDASRAEAGSKVGNCEFASLPVTPETFAFGMAALHWIVWPLFLISVSGLVRR